VRRHAWSAWRPLPGGNPATIRSTTVTATASPASLGRVDKAGRVSPKGLNYPREKAASGRVRRKPQLLERALEIHLRKA
jgi:hypothetical protein